MTSDKPAPKPVKPPTPEVIEEVRRRAADSSRPLSLHPLTPDQAVLMLLSADPAPAKKPKE